MVSPIKFVFRWLFRLLILLLVLAVAFILLLDTIAKEVVEGRLRNETGMEVRIGSVSVGLMSPVFTVENLKLYNTAEFGGSPFLDLPEFHAEYDRGLLFSHKLHYKLLRISLAELIVVRNRAGKTNVRALEEHQEKARHAAGTSKTSEGSSYKFAGIETLNITLGKARLLNMDAPSQPWDLPLNVRNKIVTGIRTDKELSDACYVILLEAGAKPLLEFVSDSRTPGTNAHPAGPDPAGKNTGKQLK